MIQEVRKSLGEKQQKPVGLANSQTTIVVILEILPKKNFKLVVNDCMNF